MHTVVICGCGFPNYEHNFEGLDLQVKNAFGNLTTVYVPETPLSLSESTIETLQGLMIPKEEYMKAALS